MSWIEKGTLSEAKVINLLRLINTEVLVLRGLSQEAHRAGFNEACDLLGAPPSDTPMERISLARARVPARSP